MYSATDDKILIVNSLAGNHTIWLFWLRVLWSFTLTMDEKNLSNINQQFLQCPLEKGLNTLLTNKSLLFNFIMNIIPCILFAQLVMHKWNLCVLSLCASHHEEKKTLIFQEGFSPTCVHSPRGLLRPNLRQIGSYPSWRQCNKDGGFRF